MYLHNMQYYLNKFVLLGIEHGTDQNTDTNYKPIHIQY